MNLLHDERDFADLVAVVGRNHGIDPALVEKDYWIMHALWGLQQQGYGFELKGGTSLSKGYGLIHRFSEDIDIRIAPPADLPIGANHDKPKHVAARRAFYDGLAASIAIPGFVSVERDTAFDDRKLRSGGIRLNYPSVNPPPPGLKVGVLLEAGFDTITPNRPRLISSWAYDFARDSGLSNLIDNRARDVPCYAPGNTLVEKLQTVSTKHRRRLETGEMPQNFMRHYYDIYCLLDDADVQAFIGTDAYAAHKAARFPAADEQVIARNDAFLLADPAVRAEYEPAYAATAALYYQGQPPFADILARLSAHIDRL